MVSVPNIPYTFLCCHCNELLVPTIFQCVQNHVLCEKCSILENVCPVCGAQFLPELIKLIGKVIPTMKFPCRYKESGCYDEFHWKILQDHEAQCNFRSYQCPIPSCDWKGCNSELKEHFTNNHQDLVIEETDNPLQFPLDFYNLYHKIYLTTSFKNTFLIHIIRTDTNFTGIVCQYVGNKRVVEDYFFEVEFWNIKRTSKLKGTLDLTSSDVVHSVNKLIILDSFFNKNYRHQFQLIFRKADVLSKSLHSCEYKDLGCTITAQEVSLDDLWIHELCCSHATIKCPECSFQGGKLALLNHGYTHYILMSNNVSESLKFNFSDNFRRLLKFEKTEPFVVQILFDPITSILHTTVQGMDNNFANYTYTVYLQFLEENHEVYSYPVELAWALCGICTSHKIPFETVIANNESSRLEVQNCDIDYVIDYNIRVMIENKTRFES